MQRLRYGLVLLIGLALGVVGTLNAGTLISLAQSTGGPCQTFPQTGQRVCGKFLAYWNAHGGLAQNGYPISPEIQEQSDLDGKTYTVQYFERAVFEYHPEYAGSAFEVLLAQLGTYRATQRYPNGFAGAALTPPQLPGTFKMPLDEGVAVRAFARGAQVYTCTAASKERSTVYSWTLKGPDALLYNDADQVIGKHYAGPTWEANDGSKVVGTVLSTAPAPDPAAIPWLLLQAQSSGTGIFADVDYVVRATTSGGVAPATGCDAARVNAEQRVDYTAFYYFYRQSR